MALSASDLAAMRTTVAVFFPDSCDIRRGTRTSDQGGGSTVVRNTVATVACRLEMPVEGSEAETAGRVGTVEGIVLKVPQGTDVTPADQANVTTSTQGASGTYEVISVDLRSNEIERVLRVKKVG